VAYRHVVLFRLREGVTPEQAAAARRLLEDLGDAVHDHPGLLAWRIEESLDARKGTVLVEEATFATEADFETFRASAPHRRATAEMARVADWFVGDYVDP
jgi:hypothetical protein